MRKDQVQRMDLEPRARYETKSGEENKTPTESLVEGVQSLKSSILKDDSSLSEFGAQ